VLLQLNHPNFFHHHLLHWTKERNERKIKFENINSIIFIDRITCDYDTSEMTGDPYTTEVQVTNSKICHTSYCLDKFSNKVASDVQSHTSLMLPFMSPDGSVITISMVLCKFGVLASGQFLFYFIFIELEFLYLKYQQLALTILKIKMRQMSIVVARNVNSDVISMKRVQLLQTVTTQLVLMTFV
jgi:hypothetical protein